MSSALLYRIYRLRRLIAVAMLPPASLLVFALSFGGAGWLVIAPLALGLPVAHALRYPRAWVETLLVSALLTLSIWVLLVASTMTGPMGLGLTALMVVVLSLGALAGLMARVFGWLDLGETQPHVVSVRHRSRLAPDQLESRLLPAPMVRTGRFACGIRSETMQTFPVTFLSDAMVRGACRLSSEPTTVLMRELPAGECEGPGREFRVVGDTGLDVSALRFDCQKGFRGSRVVLHSVSEPMTKAAARGAWLTDAMADFLADAVAHAEERPSPACLFLPFDTFVAEAGRWLRSLRPGRGGAAA